MNDWLALSILYFVPYYIDYVSTSCNCGTKLNFYQLDFYILRRAKIKLCVACGMISSTLSFTLQLNIAFVLPASLFKTLAANPDFHVTVFSTGPCAGAKTITHHRRYTML